MEDPGDKFDNLKWDFNESKGYSTIIIDSYPYKVLKKRSKEDQRRIATKLHRLRLINDQIVKDLPKYANGPGITVYRQIHTGKPNKKKRGGYLLSEMKPSTGFSGMNKPKDRVMIQTAKEVGPDGKLRAGYRDIFLILDPKTDTISDAELDLFVHELAHTGANHVQWRPDDHKLDFTSFENLIWYVLALRYLQ